MKFAKIFTILLLAVVLVVSGCSSSNNSSNNSNQSTPPSNNTGGSEPDTQNPVTIQYWHSHTDTQIDAMNYMIDEFHKQYEHITVEPIFQGRYAEIERKLMAALAARDVPAVAVMESANIANYAGSGVLMDLGPYIERDGVDLDDFSQGMLAAYNYQGVQVGLPLLVSTNVLFYNQEIFDEVGVTAPDTWEELKEVIQATSIVENGRSVRRGLEIPVMSSFYIDPWVINGGGELITAEGVSGLDQEPAKKFLRNFKEWQENGWMQLLFGDSATADMRQSFFDGETAMMSQSSSIIDWVIENASFEVGVSFLPGDVNRISNIGGPGIIIMNDIPDEEKEAAWQFMQFMTSAEYNVEWASSTGYFPTRMSAVQSPEGQEWLANNYQYSAIYDWFDNVTPRLQHEGYGEFREFLQDAVGTMALYGGDVDDLLNEAARSTNEVLAEY